jgi:crossover junction endodeoxyribonuclease RuvC
VSQSPENGRIIGIDPGSLHTGYGVLACRGAELKLLAYGVVSPKEDWPLALRLAHIHRAIMDLMAEHQPSAMALEEVFTFKNPRSAIKLAQARGVSVLAAGLSNVPVYEYSPTLVKSVVAGSGRADKKQVAYMVAQIFDLRGPIGADASDALAIAVCHAGQSNSVLTAKGLAAASHNRASSWRNLSLTDLEALGYKVEKNQR